MPLSTAFGADTEGAQWIVGYLLEKVINNLSVWSSEAELANDTVELLVTLVEKRERWGHPAQFMTGGVATWFMGEEKVY